jgi:hypothetical protein
MSAPEPTPLRASDRPPTDPYAVLAAAILLPASGHVWLGLVPRALTFLFFMLALGWVSTRFAAPDTSFIGQHAGGVLVYAISVLDAYRIARTRRADWQTKASRPS